MLEWPRRRKIIKGIRAYLVCRRAALKHAHASDDIAELAASRGVAIIAGQVFLPLLFPTPRMWSSGARASRISALQRKLAAACASRLP